MQLRGTSVTSTLRARLAAAVLALAGAATLQTAWATTDTFTSDGTWVAPSGITSVTVEAWGGGGAGGGATTNPGKGGGGAGGQYARKVVTVVPGTSYAVTIGLGGSGGSGTGSPGGESKFGSSTVVAKGGAGGSAIANGVGGLGSTTSGVGDVVYAGGNGSDGSTGGTGGAGGGGAGSTGAGGDASGNTAGTGASTGGGNGAAGLTSRGTGGTGSVAGGGGGGGYKTNSTDRNGGAGGKGQVSITYTPVPTVNSINRASYNPTFNNKSVSWTVVFNTSVTGVDTADFSLVMAGGATGASITGVTGSGTSWTVTANTGTAGSGTLTLKLVDDDSIAGGGIALGGSGTGNANFTGQAYTLITTVCSGASDILFCDDFERSNAGSVGNGWTVTPTTASDCNGSAGNTGCAGIDADVPPYNNAATTLRPNPTRAMFTRWGQVAVDSPAVNLAGKTGAQLSFWIRRGQDTFSECPEASGENYLVQYYDSSGVWKTLAQYPSSPSASLCDGRIFTPIIELPADALHSGFKMRFYQPSGSGDSGSGGAPSVVGYDYWHMDDVVIRETAGPTYSGAFCENFEAGIARWSVSAEGAPTTGAIGDASIGSSNYQSSSNALDLRWGYVSAATFKTDLTGVSGNITYWVKSGTTTDRDPDSGENLVVEYLNSSGTWTTLATYLGTAAASTVYTATHVLPDDAKHANFRLRVRLLAGSGYDKDYWHVDDVCVGNSLPSADLALTKTGGTLVPGSTSVYTLRVTNNGPGTLSGSAQVVDTLPVGLTYLGGAGTGWACSANAQVVTCTWTGTLANGATTPDLSLTVSIAGNVSGAITNSAVLTSTVNDSNLGNNTATYTSGNFTPVFAFTDGACADGIAFGQAGQGCNQVDWSGLQAGQTRSNVYLTTISATGVPTSLSTSSATTVSLQFGLTCHDPTSDAGVQASFTGASPATLPLCATGGAQPTTQWSAARSFTFASGAPSVPTAYTFSYNDVGQVELFMRNASAIAQLGTSGTFVQTPAGFTLTEIKPTANASGRCAVATTPSPAVTCASVATDAARFVAAGESFSATVTARTSTGAAAPNFGREVSPESVKLVPTNVVVGMVSAPDISGDFGAFSAGVATGTAFQWSEVGIITLTPTVKDGNYLGTGNVTGTTSGNVGRFYPDHLNTTMTAGCSAAFTYSGQPFALNVTAYAAGGTVTANYDGTLGLARAIDISGVGATGAVTGGDVGGQPARFGASNFTAGATPALNHASVLKPTFTFTTALTAASTVAIRAVDTDGVTSSGGVEGSSTVGSGRARMFNAYGSELMDLPVVFRAEVWGGSPGSWLLNSADTCTDATLSFAAAGSTNITSNTCVLETGNNSGKGCAAALTYANRKYLEAGVSGTDSSGVAGFAGNFNLWLKAPGATHPGSIDVTATVPAWLQYNWTGTVASPKARATFGVYKSPLVYRRENY